MNPACDPIRDFLEETRRLLRELDPQAIARARDLLSRPLSLESRVTARF